MKIRKLVKNEKGSGTVIIMVCLVLGAIFFGLLFFDFSNVFINKRVTQTGADAAGIAAAQTANEHMRIELQRETQDALDDLGKRWEDFLEAATAVPPVPPIEELFQNFVTMIEVEKRKTMPNDVKSWIRDRSVSVEAETAMKFFFKDEEVSEMSCEAVLDHWDEVEDAAEEYAEKNQNDQLSDITFIGEDFRIYVETERKGKYTTVSDDQVPPIKSDSSVLIGEPKGYEGKISCN